jgi:hypothetical protein
VFLIGFVEERKGGIPMRISIRLAAAAMVAVIVVCGSGFGNDDYGSPDSGPGTDAGADADTDGDMDSDSDSDDDDDYCDDVEFPPSNGPDGCKRILLSKTPDGVPFQNETTSDVAISRDGSLAAFGVFYNDYDGDGLPEDTNGKDDVYAVDLNTMEIEIVSISSDGQLFTNSSYSPSVSADGRYVTFRNGNGVFVRDRVKGETERVSVSSDGMPAGGGGSDRPFISGDGRYVVFNSHASNLVPGDTNNEEDLFLRDRVAGTTERLTVDEEGGETFGNGGSLWANVSDDGRYVLFMSRARLSELDDDPESEPEWDVYLRDRETGKNLMPTMAPDGYRSKSAISLSPDGTRVLFEGNTYHYLEVDEDKINTSVLLSVRNGEEFTFEPVERKDGVYGGHGVYAINTDYRYVVGGCAEGYVENLDLRPSGSPIANVCVLDRDSGEITLVTAAEDGTPGVIPFYDDGTPMVDSVTAAISGDGKRIIFSTTQYGIVDNHDLSCTFTPRQVYLRDCPSDGSDSDSDTDSDTDDDTDGGTDDMEPSGEDGCGCSAAGESGPRLLSILRVLNLPDMWILRP